MLYKQKHVDLPESKLYVIKANQHMQKITIEKRKRKKQNMHPHIIGIDQEIS